jgi:peptidoglycan/xylan/chitin deacetylase (PgdA/CDA1 family)
MGYVIIPSEIRIYDAVMGKEKKDKVVNQTIEKIIKHNGGIVLLHDARDSHYCMEKKLSKKPDSAFDRSWIPETVERIIIALLERGFVLGSPDLIIENP